MRHGTFLTPVAQKALLSLVSMHTSGVSFSFRASLCTFLSTKEHTSWSPLHGCACKCGMCTSPPHWWQRGPSHCPSLWEPSCRAPGKPWDCFWWSGLCIILYLLFVNKHQLFSFYTLNTNKYEIGLLKYYGITMFFKIKYSSDRALRPRPCADTCLSSMPRPGAVPVWRAENRSLQVGHGFLLPALGMSKNFF